MCGIAGFIGWDSTDDSAAQLMDRMCQVIRHRGPDDQGTWAENDVALGMRRLSIIDLAGGHQPAFNEDRSVLVVFNGEIYNYRELQRTLRDRGHTFSTDCDTEVIVHAYEEYGDECVQHLRGMFTFAIWDRKRRRLLAARDRFGKKPLNYYWDGRSLILGSEIKSILEAQIPREINPLALDEYLTYGYIPAPNTIFKDVWKVPAGHILTYEAGRIQVRRYWEISFEPSCTDDEATAIERIRALLKDAVQVRLMSDVPLGAFLSGGVDSSIVVAYMSQLMAEPVKTFSIGFDDDSANELPYAREVAEYFGTDHHEFVVHPELASVMPKLIWACDEPFADPSILPTYYVSKLARQHVTVALSGDGGDEIFGGYTAYQRELSMTRLPAPVRYIGGRVAPLWPDRVRGKHRLTAMGQNLGTRFVHSNSHFPYALRPSLYNREHFALVREHDPRQRQLSLFHGTEHLDTAARVQRADAHLYLTDDILVKVDKASMFCSLETRAPLLDQHLVSYVASLPSALRTQNDTLKYLLKKAAEGIVPDQVLTRRKHGFSVPLDRWLRTDLATFTRDLLDSSTARQRGIFQPKFVRALLDGHRHGRVARFGTGVWALLCLELWFREYMDAPQKTSPSPS